VAIAVGLRSGPGRDDARHWTHARIRGVTILQMLAQPVRGASFSWKRKMSFPDRRTINVLLTALFFSAVLAIAYIARAALVTFCFSILFAYLMNPLVSFLQRNSLLFRNLRGPHVAEAYLALLIFSALVIYTLAPVSLNRTTRFLRELPAVSDRLATGEIATE